MATLAENITKTKENFRNIRKAINDVGDAVAFEPLTNEPVEEYPARLNEVVDHYGLSRYEDGYADGKADGGGVDLSKCKYIEKQATGKVIALNDVSEVYHKVKVYGDNTQVEVYGKNLFDGILESGYIDNDGTLKNYNGTVRSTSHIPLLPNTSYSLSTKNGNVKLYARFYDADKNGIGNGGVLASTTITFTSPSNSAYFKFYADTSDVATEVQFEFGGATPYEPYTHQTITATPTGTEVSSMCPKMNFFADSDITVDYYGSFGMQTEYDRFWDSYQSNGTRTDYGNAFSGRGWNDATFKPKYDIKPSGGAGNMFISSWVTDLAKNLDECGVVLDTSSATSMQYAFQGSKLTRLPKIDLSNTISTTNMLYSCLSLLTVEELVCAEKNVFTNGSFQNCTAFTHCIFSGVIASPLNVQWCPFDDETLISLGDTVIDLYDAGIEEGSLILTLSDACKQRLQELEHPMGSSYYDYIVGYKGWTIE